MTMISINKKGNSASTAVPVSATASGMDCCFETVHVKNGAWFFAGIEIAAWLTVILGLLAGTSNYHQYHGQEPWLNWVCATVYTVIVVCFVEALRRENHYLLIPELTLLICRMLSLGLAVFYIIYLMTFSGKNFMELAETLLYVSENSGSDSFSFDSGDSPVATVDPAVAKDYVTVFAFVFISLAFIFLLILGWVYGVLSACYSYFKFRKSVGVEGSVAKNKTDSERKPEASFGKDVEALKA